MALALVVASAAFAEKATPEERAARDYSTWLPAQGDWSIGFSLDPIATFVGNMFNNSTFNTLTDLGGESLSAFNRPLVSFMGTYMLSDQLSVRGNVGLVLGWKNDKQYVQDDAQLLLNPLSHAKVIDHYNSLTTGGSISLGVEYRVGKTRPVQGVFGGGLMYEFDVNQDKYAYGNAISDWNQLPSEAYGAIVSVPVPYYTGGGRVLRNYDAIMNHTVGLYGSVGIEWFVAPKIALGANVNLLLAYTIKDQRFQDVEGWNTITDQRETWTELIKPRHGELNFGSSNIGANLYMAFYFGK